MDAIHTEQYRGLTINIFYDDGHGCHPRQDCDNLTKMVCFHRRYDLGDKHEYSQTELQELIKHKHIEALPLYLYDHSGISISTGSVIGRAQHVEWDSAQVGYIFISQAVILENWPKCRNWRKKAKEVMKSDTKVYDDYLRGNVYGYRVEDSEGNELDSCWGYIGDYDGYVLSQAKSMIDYLTEEGKTDYTGQQLLFPVKV